MGEPISLPESRWALRLPRQTGLGGRRTQTLRTQPQQTEAAAHCGGCPWQGWHPASGPWSLGPHVAERRQGVQDARKVRAEGGPTAPAIIKPIRAQMTQQSLSRILTRQITSKRKAAENLRFEVCATPLTSFHSPVLIWAPAASLGCKEEETLWYCLKSNFKSKNF